jgi:hypothetical protein
LQASPSLFRFKYSRVNVPNRNIQLNPTQLSTNPSYAFRLTSSKIPKYVPTPLKKKQQLPHRPGHIAPKLPALYLRQQRIPCYPLDQQVPPRLCLLDDVYTLLAALAHVGEDVSDPVALVLHPETADHRHRKGSGTRRQRGRGRMNFPFFQDCPSIVGVSKPVI